MSKSRPEAKAAGRRGLPLFPTLFVLLAVPLMISLGMWQLHRLHWKENMLARASAAANLPRLSVGQGPLPADPAFRRVDIGVRCPQQPPIVRGGSPRSGDAAGYSILLVCTTAHGQKLGVDIGWTGRPDGWRRSEEKWPAGEVSGTLIPSSLRGIDTILILDRAIPPLADSRVPGPDSISNNHLSYAVQWFFFATALGIIWLIYVRRWRSGG